MARDTVTTSDMGSGASLPLETTAGYNFVSIKRTGN